MRREPGPESDARGGPAVGAAPAAATGAADMAGAAERMRRRVRLMIEITARAGEYRRGLVKAAGRLSDEEAVILDDLEQHGLQVPQLRDVLRGGHVLVDDPALYDKWRTGQGNHPRLSSHHRDIDKKRYPDFGMRGHVVREKLHGRTANGTWVQLEKTPAAFGGSKAPSLDDLRHLVDYLQYRFTGSNVGPWGLSRMTERRPLYLSPMVAVPTSLTPPVARTLARTLRRIEESDDTTAVSRELAAHFPPPDRADLGGELGQALTGRGGRGLFGNSEVWVTQAPSRTAARVLRERHEPPGQDTWRSGGPA
ncbi:hypothetical protein [Streptomyces sp. CA2R106]|uniref:hypothetical protein n=1 Tax=Streptomyces sp. CA2R106 TaxID=3120153 RepID=UPI0030099130